MGHDITAHWLDKKSETGYREESHAYLRYNAFYGGAGELYDLLGASKYNGGPSGIGDGCKVSKQKVVAALDHFCKKRVDGEECFAELSFLATILTEWWPGARSVYIHFG